MDTPQFYEIVVEGLLSGQWSDWFEGLAIENDPSGETRLKGLLADQAALYGVLSKIHNLNLVLVSVVRMTEPESQDGEAQKEGTSTQGEW
jgi:hypothetical protein